MRLLRRCGDICGGWGMSEPLDFQHLVVAIRDTHQAATRSGMQAVNVVLTLRNWVIGHHILSYEQQGQDRAQYGARLLENLATRLQQELDRSYTGRYLGLCRQFCNAYPQIWKSLNSESATLPIGKSLIRKSLISESESGEPDSSTSPALN